MVLCVPAMEKVDRILVKSLSKKKNNKKKKNNNNNNNDNNEEGEENSLFSSVS